MKQHQPHCRERYVLLYFVSSARYCLLTSFARARDLNFRRDINGLRAIAVIGVVLFHFDQSWLPGGFAGVDVFFVISGFLMTKIIISRMEVGNFSIIRFYVDRANRIIPPLVVLCASLLLFGFFALIPMDYKLLGQHIFSSLLFFSNFTFFGEAGYFDWTAYQKWLLHTWSLSVEWQFYVIYPIILAIIKKILNLKNIKILLCFLTIFGFLGNLLVTYFFPEAAYFLLHARAWELLAGGSLFFITSPNNQTTKTILSWLGLMLIVASFYFVDGMTPWPGTMALLPVLGSGLLIIAQQKDGGILNNGFLQKIGDASYSIYLWHWIILVANYKYYGELGVFPYVVLALLIGVLSRRFFERLKPVYYVPGLLLTLAGSAFVVYSDGVETRVSEVYRLTKSEFHSQYYGGVGYPSDQIIHINSSKDDYDLFFFGDSVGFQYTRSLDKKELRVAALFDHGCMILPNYTRFIGNKEDTGCASRFDVIKEEVSKNNKDILISHAWDGYPILLGKKNSGERLDLTEFEYFSVLESELDIMAESLGTDRKYFLIGVPQYAHLSGFECLARGELLGFFTSGGCRLTQERDVIKANQALEAYALRHSNFEFFNPNDYICDAGKCFILSDQEAMYSDQSHLSVVGSDLVLDGILTDTGDLGAE